MHVSDTSRVFTLNTAKRSMRLRALKLI